MKKKELYSAPKTEVLELRLEGVIATSPNGSTPELDEQPLDW